MPSDSPHDRNAPQWHAPQKYAPVRTTASTPGHTEHIWDNDRISFADEADDEYDQNIQIAELNMLNAALAVIKWKKIFGFYTDFEHEHSSTYTIDGNHLLNEDQADEARSR